MSSSIVTLGRGDSEPQMTEDGVGPWTVVGSTLKFERDTEAHAELLVSRLVLLVLVD